MISSKPLIVTAIAAWTLLMVPNIACAQEKYPNRPIRMLVTFSVGSLTDILARMVGAKMSENWGQQVVIDNRPGGGGIAASQALIAANADGYTLMMVSSGHAASATLYSKLPYDTLRDFAGISQVVSGGHVLAVSKDLGVKSVKELIALAKAKPGQITFGTAATGSGSHINAEMFKIDTGINATHVAYKGPIEALTDVLGGRVTYALVSTGVAAPFIRDGRLVPLGVSTAKRDPMFPNVPTIAEAGVAGHEYDQWFGLLAPAKVPRAIVNQLSREVARILELPDVKERIVVLGSVPKPSTPEQFDAFIRSEVQKLGKVIKAANLRID